MTRKWLVMKLVMMLALCACLTGCIGPQMAGDTSKANNELAITKGPFGGGAKFALGADTTGRVTNFKTEGGDGSVTSFDELMLEQKPQDVISAWSGPMAVYNDGITRAYDGLAKVAEANWKGASEFMRSSVGVAAAIAWRAGANGQSFDEIKPMLDALSSLNARMAEIEKQQDDERADDQQGEAPPS